MSPPPLDCYLVSLHDMGTTGYTVTVHAASEHEARIAAKRKAIQKLDTPELRVVGLMRMPA